MVLVRGAIFKFVAPIVRVVFWLFASVSGGKQEPAVEPRLASGGVWWRNDDSSTPEVTFCGVVHPGYRHRDGRRVRRRTGLRRGISAGPGPEDQICVVSTEIRTVEFLLVAPQSQPNQPLEAGCKQIHVAHGTHRPRCSAPQPSLRDSAAACELACPDGRPRWVISAPCSCSLHGRKTTSAGLRRQSSGRWNRRGRPRDDQGTVTVMRAVRAAMPVGSRREEFPAVISWRPRQDLNLRPAVPETDALSAELRGPWRQGYRSHSPPPARLCPSWTRRRSGSATTVLR